MADGGKPDPNEENDDEENFEDASESLPRKLSVESMDLRSSIADAVASMDLFLNNKFTEARAHYQRWADRSMYHALGYGTIMSLQATMTFQADDIKTAIATVKNAVDVCGRYRKKSRFLDSLHHRHETYYDDLTAEEIHAEVCYAECLLERAALTFIQDENLISFIKGSLKIRACYNSYKECAQILERRNWKDADEKTHFESGVCMGIGAFNLMISLLPTRIMKLLEFVGFSGNKRKGLQMLERGSSLRESMRGPLCSFTLLAYHAIITYILGTGDGDVELVDRILQELLLRYPKGALVLFYAGRVNEIKGNIDEAVVKFEESVDSQQSWQQFHHFCYWELMWCHCFQGDWLLAMKYAEKLLSDSNWSKATYAYQKASFLLMSEDQNDEGTKDHVAYLLEQVPKLKQRIAGKSLPIEKFAVKKSELYFEQGRRLTLPAYELFYVWNGFSILSKSPKLLNPVLLKVEETIRDMASRKETYLHYGDDYCLALLVKGVCLAHKTDLKEAEECFRYIEKHGDDVRVDKYVIPSALYEIAMIYLSQNRLEEAKETLDRAKNEYKGYSLESRLHFRIHSAYMRLKALQLQDDGGN